MLTELIKRTGHLDRAGAGWIQLIRAPQRPDDGGSNHRKSLDNTERSAPLTPTRERGGWHAGVNLEGKVRE
eukprot:1993291-Rhodomonas_salina.1